MTTSRTAGSAEELLVRCLECEPDQRGALLERLCQENPETADELRRLHARLDAIGLLSALGEADRFPERLGEFRLLERLGGGGMGVVYLADQPSMGRKVALKIMLPAYLYHPGARERFRREAHAIATLEHSNIVPVYAFGEDQDLPYLAMQWVDGRSLEETIDGLRGLAPVTLTAADLTSVLGTELGSRFHGTWPQVCVRILLPIADALSHAHAHQVIHRDVKPSNVMLSADGRVMLLDFGLAQTSEGEHLTRTGSQPGSLPYMAPEQVRGDATRVGERSDLYSLGVTLYELLTLQLPYRAENPEKTRQSILEGRHLPVRALNPAVPCDVETVCHKAMELRPGRRYPDVAAFRAELDNLLEHRPITARPPGAWSRLAKWAQRHPGVAVMAAVTLLIVLAFVAGIVQQNRRLDAQANRRLRLSDLTAHESLMDWLAALGPVHPDNENEYREWVAAADELVSRLPMHERTLAKLHATGVGVVEGAVEAGPETHRKFRERHEHDRLTELIGKLNELVDLETGRLPLMRRRLEAACNLRRWTIARHAGAWQQARLELRADARFEAVDLRPQIGLIPLGCDPRSELQEFLHLLTHEGPIPTRDDDGELTIDSRCGLIFVLLPAATFWMGAQSADPDRPNYDPDPRREYGIDDVRLDPFFLAKYEMTQGQWWRARRRRPSFYGKRDTEMEREGADCLPVENITWFTAQRALHKVDLELPTEAQWEYACRAGSQTIWSTGDTATSLDGYANLKGRETGLGVPDSQADSRDRHSRMAPFGSYLPNDLGLHDMLGNVTEWCRDGLHAYAEATARHGDGLRGSGGSPVRIARGGSYLSRTSTVKSGHRAAQLPTTRTAQLGVRPARRLER